MSNWHVPCEELAREMIERDIKCGHSDINYCCRLKFYTCFPLDDKLLFITWKKDACCVFAGCLESKGLCTPLALEMKQKECKSEFFWGGEK